MLCERLVSGAARHAILFRNILFFLYSYWIGRLVWRRGGTVWHDCVVYAINTYIICTMYIVHICENSQQNKIKLRQGEYFAVHLPLSTHLLLLLLHTDTMVYKDCAQAKATQLNRLNIKSRIHALFIFPHDRVVIWICSIGRSLLYGVAE